MPVKLGGSSLRDLTSISERIYPGWRGPWVVGGDFVNTQTFQGRKVPMP